MSLEDQLICLKELGFDLNTGFSVKHLLEEFDRKKFDKDPYRLLLVVMGGEVEGEDGKWVPISNKIWHFDAECIEDNGDYIRIMRHLRELAEGYLPIDNVKDYVDVDGGQHWFHLI